MANDSTADTTSSQPAVGIDLGTTYSVVAYLDPTGRPLTVLNGVGDMLTPSTLLFEDNEVIIGKEAAKSSVITPAAFADCFKRDMGNPLFRRMVRGTQLPPEVLSGFILERLKQDAERRIGPIRQVVITVPAFFDETRRKATQDAGRLAGLEVLDIINEPTAAAVAYGHQQGFLQLDPTAETPPKLRVLVYDLGGGTFDVTILELSGGKFQALATDGDVLLGGKDFDERLVNYISEQFIAEHGRDPRSDPEDAAQLWLDAQEAKHTLSERARATVVCYHAGIRQRVEISRENFEELTSDLLGRSETTVSLLVRQAGLTWADIDRVLLVGGASRMPAVVQMLKQLTGKEPDQSLSPDEAVAQGAALYAGMLMKRAGQGTGPDCELVNVNSHSLGVVGLDPRTKRRTNVIVIPRNTPLPHEAVRMCKTAHANQTSVVVSVVEGESKRPEECIQLGKCVIRDLPAALPAGTPIQVHYRYQSNGRIHVSARMPGTRQSAHVEITRDRTHDLKTLDVWRRLLQEAGGRKPAQPPTPPAAQPLPIATPSAVAQPLPPQAPAVPGNAAPPPPLAVPAQGGENPAAPRIVWQEVPNPQAQLDELHFQVGRAAIAIALPPDLAAPRQTAAHAEQKLAAAEERFGQAIANDQSAESSSEAIQTAAAVARAKSELDHVRTQASAALATLGRECVARQIFPPGVESLLGEIARLRAPR